MTDYGYDAAYFQRTEILQSGCVVVFVYTDGGHAYTAAEVAQIHAVKPIVFNHENAVTELAGGYAAGVLAASHAMAAVKAFGAPADGSVAIFYSVDVNVATVGFGPYRSAFDGINDAHAGQFKVGVYGEGALIDDLAASGRIQAKGWLSASSSFPGYNPASPNVGAFQQVGTDIPNTDRDVITNLPGLAPWWAAGESPSGGGTPLGDDDMTDAQFQQLIDTLNTNANNQVITLAGHIEAAAGTIVAGVRAAITDSDTTLAGHIDALPAAFAAAVVAELPAAAAAPTAAEIASAVLDAESARLQS